MTNLMRSALGADWNRLPPALQAHYRDNGSIDIGTLDIEYPRALQLLMSGLRFIGALIDRRGVDIVTVVKKETLGERQYWRRTMTFPDGQVIRFNSVWAPAGDQNRHVVEFVNPVFGLQMQPYVVDGRLHYRGIRYVAALGRFMFSVPEWLLLGHTTIVEEAVDDDQFVMDFRLTHPLFGQVFRYSGRFRSVLPEVAGPPQ